MSRHTSNPTLQAIWAIRDAEGLSCHERCFLVMVASRGNYHRSTRAAAAEMGMSRASFYRTRLSLVDKGLLEVNERARTTTEYRVRVRAVMALSPLGRPSQIETGVSHPETGVSHTETGGVSGSAPEEGPEEGPEEDREDARDPKPHLRLASGSSDPTPEYLAELRDKVRNKPIPARRAW